MADFVVWLDSQKALVFELKTSGIEKSTIEKSGIDHHTQNKKDRHTDQALEHLFHDLANRMRDAQQILILGPGLAKTHFKTYLETHHTAGLAKKIIGLEDCDHPSDKQILAASRTFFIHYDQFNNPI